MVKKKAPEDRLVTLSTKASPQVCDRVRKIAYENRLTASELVREMVEHYLANPPPPRRWRTPELVHSASPAEMPAKTESNVTDLAERLRAQDERIAQLDQEVRRWIKHPPSGETLPVPEISLAPVLEISTARSRSSMKRAI